VYHDLMDMLQITEYPAGFYTKGRVTWAISRVPMCTCSSCLHNVAPGELRYHDGNTDDAEHGYSSRLSTDAPLVDVSQARRSLNSPQPGSFCPDTRLSSFV